MKIALIWDSDYPWDVRVEKVSNTLIKAGHEVHLICRNTRKEKKFEILDDIRIHRLPVVSSNYFINKSITFPAFFNPIWLETIRTVIEKTGVEYVIVRDLPLCPAGIWVSRQFNIPCSMDMAECYPELLRCIWKFEKFRFLNTFVRNPLLADLVERYCIRNLSKIFVMVQESRDRLIGMGVPSSKIEIVSNTPLSSIVDSVGKPRDKALCLNLLYLGILNPSRGLDTALQGIAYLKSSGIPCSLQIAGSGKAFEDLKNLVSKLGIADSVKFHGWVDRKDIARLFLEADVGLVPHHVCGHWNTTVPNKLFDYMAAGIPVLSSNAVPMARIINEQNCGVIYNDGDPESFAAGIRRLRDDIVRCEMGSNGRKAVISYYNWDVDSKRLTAAIGPAI